MIGGIEVIDFHGHAGLWDGVGMVDDVDTMVAAMDAVGVDRSCVFGIFHLDGRRGNDRAAAIIAARPERFIGFAYVSPLMPDSMLDELTRAVDRLGFRALKLYAPHTPYKISDREWDPIYDFADARGLAVLHHTDERCSPAHLAEAARRFPNARFVAAHSGNTPPARKLAIAAARELPNYYLETASTYRTPGVTEELVAGAGAERVVFGSDTPLMDPRSQIGKIITADISDAAKRLILGENARLLLGLVGGRGLTLTPRPPLVREVGWPGVWIADLRRTRWGEGEYRTPLWPPRYAGGRGFRRGRGEGAHKGRPYRIGGRGDGRCHDAAWRCYHCPALRHLGAWRRRYAAPMGHCRL